LFQAVSDDLKVDATVLRDTAKGSTRLGNDIEPGMMDFHTPGQLGNAAYGRDEHFVATSHTEEQRMTAGPVPKMDGTSLFSCLMQPTGRSSTSNCFYYLPFL
jgi:hypothetical protein